MARSLSQTKRILALVSDALPLPLHRRGYAASVSVGASGSKLEDKSATLTRQASEASSAWVPDPVTGYYRPINHTSEIDPAELREMLLNRKVRSSH